MPGVLRKHGADHLLADRLLDLPVLFHHGRSDLSVDFYGATVAPDSVREFLYADSGLARDVATYRVISYEDGHADKQLLFAFELNNAVPGNRYA